MFRDWKLGEPAWFYPDGTADGVALVADLMGWYFAPFDAPFDGELGRNPAVAKKVIQDLTSILDLPEGAAEQASYPVALAFADIWRRSSQHMSPAWRQRAAYHWKKYLIAQLGEVVNRAHDRKPDAVSHLRQRIATTSADPLVDLIESVGGFEPPDVAWHMPKSRSRGSLNRNPLASSPTRNFARSLVRSSDGRKREPRAGCATARRPDKMSSSETCSQADS